MHGVITGVVFFEYSLGLPSSVYVESVPLDSLLFPFSFAAHKIGLWLWICSVGFTLGCSGLGVGWFFFTDSAAD